MKDQSDRQTSIFSSYKGRNESSYEFLVKNESVKNTTEIQVALKEFVKNVLKHFDKYNIPKLKFELLGLHLKNPHNALYKLCETHLNWNICSYIRKYSIQDEEPPSVKLSKRQEQIKIDINRKIMRELMSFPQLNFLKHAFDDYFKQIEKTLVVGPERH